MHLFRLYPRFFRKSKMKCPTNQKDLHKDSKRAGVKRAGALPNCCRVLFPEKGGHQGRTRKYKGRNCKPVRIFRPLPKKSGLKNKSRNAEHRMGLRYSRDVNALLHRQSREYITFGQPVPAQPVF